MWQWVTLWLRLSLALHSEHATPERIVDAALFATVCTREATPLVSAERLCAIAWIESRLSYRAISGPHCGAWQQNPSWSQMWGDDCWKNGELNCRQPGGAGVTCEQLVDVTTASRVASRHLHHLTARYGSDRALCRYAGATGERCQRRIANVRRLERRFAE